MVGAAEKTLWRADGASFMLPPWARTPNRTTHGSASRHLSARLWWWQIEHHLFPTMPRHNLAKVNAPPLSVARRTTCLSLPHPCSQPHASGLPLWKGSTTLPFIGNATHTPEPDTHLRPHGALACPHASAYHTPNGSSSGGWRPRRRITPPFSGKHTMSSLGPVQSRGDVTSSPLVLGSVGRVDLLPTALQRSVGRNGEAPHATVAPQVAPLVKALFEKHRRGDKWVPPHPLASSPSTPLGCRV